MGQESRQSELHEQTQHLLQGPLKHIRSAALAAALLPLASVAATPAAAQSAACASGGICGTVWNDANNNGTQDAGESGIEGAVVSLDSGWDVTATDSQGFYYFSTSEGTHTLAVQIPPGTEPAPTDMGGDDTLDSDGASDGIGNSVAVVTFYGSPDPNTDFGFHVSPVAQPGTGTPGYWKNHPEAWPVSTITVAGVTYTKEQAIGWLETAGNDRTIAMFSSLVPAMLNVMIDNDDSCVASTITAADHWLATYGPMGVKKVHPASYAWKIGEPLHRLLDNYNNGMLCAPHRN
jgi:hypothetical protein